MFIQHKEALEQANYKVTENEVYGPQGQPVAGVDAYQQVWFKDEFVEKICKEEVEMVRARNSKGHILQTILVLLKMKLGQLKRRKRNEYKFRSFRLYALGSVTF